MHDQVDLTPSEWERYARQVGSGVLTEAGQRRLKNSSVLITRVGGMGGPAALMLAMSGVGRVTIAHGGILVSPDLNRQVLGCEAGLGELRAPAFADYLRSMNRFVEIASLDYEPDDSQSVELARSHDLILSCAPTFEERLRLNQAAATARIPIIDAAQWGMSGTLMVLHPGRTACLQCVYPQQPQFEKLFPVVGAISSAIGSLAALEGIKVLSQCGRPSWGKLQMLDGFRGHSSLVELRRRPDCPCCRSLNVPNQE